MTNSDCNDDQGWTDGWDNDTICFARGNTSTGTIQPPLPNGEAGTCGLIFGSNHASGMNVVLCDGSVRTVSYTIDPNAWLIFCQTDSGGVLNWGSF